MISPESCSSILWRSWEHKEKAAEALKLTAKDMLKNGLIDGVIPEPLGGAHNNPEQMYQTLKDSLQGMLNELSKLSPEKLIETRISKFSKMGAFTEA